VPLSPPPESRKGSRSKAKCTVRRFTYRDRKQALWRVTWKLCTVPHRNCWVSHALGDKRCLLYSTGTSIAASFWMTPQIHTSPAPVGCRRISSSSIPCASWPTAGPIRPARPTSPRKDGSISLAPCSIGTPAVSSPQNPSSASEAVLTHLR
jgi:hypothetical protein